MKVSVRQAITESDVIALLAEVYEIPEDYAGYVLWNETAYPFNPLQSALRQAMDYLGLPLPDKRDNATV